jgi:hypothetical protein
MAVMAAKLATLEAEIVEVRAENAALKKNFSATYVTVDQLDEELFSVTEGLTESITSAQSVVVDRLDTRVDGALNDIAGFDATKENVVTLAEDVEYLLAHVENITKCGVAEGQIHLGDGKCASAVPQCDAPAAPKDGAVALSSPYIIPGVVASYSCNKEGAFLAGDPLPSPSFSRDPL